MLMPNLKIASGVEILKSNIIYENLRKKEFETRESNL